MFPGRRVDTGGPRLRFRNYVTTWKSNGAAESEAGDSKYTDGESANETERQGGGAKIRLPSAVTLNALTRRANWHANRPLLTGAAHVASFFSVDPTEEAEKPTRYTAQQTAGLGRHGKAC